MGSPKPEIVLSKDGRHITVKGPFPGLDHTFELVDQVTGGYMIWNIGKNMADGYLPLCRLSAHQPFPGGMSIETDTLRAIKCDGAQIILAAVGFGPETVKAMEKYIQKHENGAKNGWIVKRMKAALPYMRQIKGLEG